MTLRSTLLTVALSTIAAAQSYHLSQDFSGPSFFQGFKYNESAIDPTNFGNVHYLSQAQAQAANLTFINSAGRAVVRVDNFTNGANDPTFGRNSVYLLSNQLMTMGSLLVFDAVHVPLGCSVWPALFTQGQQWPQQGEIDIVENVNLATKNQYSLHAGVSSCMAATTTNQTGSTTSPNCTVDPLNNQNTGCVTQDASDNSFGQGFVSSGGGVYAMLWDENGIAMWFFERSKVPSGIDTNPDPTKFSTPAAFYPASGCDPKAVFGPQIITLYIDICGAFAGNTGVFQQTCANVAPNCSSMVPTPSNYDNAYWEINYLRVFTTNSSAATATPGGTGTGAGSNPTGGAKPGSNSGFSLHSVNGFVIASSLAAFFALALMF